MAVRNEAVRLTLHDDFTTGMAKAAAATALLRRELKGLGGDGRLAVRELESSTKTVDKLGSGSRRAGPEIDRLSGRLRLLRDAAVVLGPALVPLGAATIPLLTGSIAALGAASGGLGAAILAFNGLGDAMDAIDDFQLEPTAENLQKMRIELERMGPAGADFARFLQDLAPEMTRLQMVAREGMFPGIEQGIDDLLTRLPLVQQIIGRLSRGVGDLTAEAGADLASDDWTPFLEYVRRTGRPTLEAFARSLGNIAQGLADMMVAFAPVTRDFTRGMEEMSESFAEWAAGLGENETFQDFLDYIRQSGPQALDLLGSLAEMFVAIVQAAAPIGSALLPVLTTLAKIIGTIADTPLGQAFLTAAVAVTAYNRAASLAVATSTRLQGALGRLSGRGTVAGIGLVAASMTDLDDKMGLSNTAMLGMAGMLAGPWGAAVGAGVGLTLDLAAANDSLAESIERADDAMQRGSVEDMLERRRELVTQLDEQHPGFSLGRNVDFGNAGDILRGVVNDFSGASSDAQDKIAELDRALAAASPSIKFFGLQINTAGLELLAASEAARQFQGAIAELNGWLDKRQALRDYRDGIRDLTKGLKDGFGRQDVENVDQMGRNIIKVAETIKSPEVRADFLANARASLQDLANKAGPKARAEIQNLIDKMDELGLTNPKPKVDAQTDAALLRIRAVKAELASIDRSIDVYVNVRRPNAGGMGAQVGNADGGTIGGQRHPYGDKMFAFLAPGEEVISNRYGQADRHRALLKAINANRMADGGTAGRSGPMWTSTLLPHAADAVTTSLRGLKRQLEESEQALERERRQRDAVRSKMADLASGVSSGLRTDIFAEPSNVWAAQASVTDMLSADIAKGREFIRLVKQLKSKGLDGPALAELLMSGDIERARLFASMSAHDLRQYERLYEQREQILGQAGQAAGQAAFGAEERRQTAQLQAVRRELQQIKQAIKNADRNNTDGHKDNAATINQGFSGAARSAIRRGKALV